MRGGLARSGFEETSEALFLTSGFVYDSAEEAEAAFKGEVDRFVYSRYGNPTVAMFEERLRLLEGAEACFATASGMSAVFVALAALLGQGDRVVVLARPVRLVLRHPRRDPAALGRRDRLRRRRRPRPVARGAVRADHGRVLRDAEQPDAGARRHRGRDASWPTPPGRKVVVDNVFGTPVFSKPLELGADVVVYSATKHIDGQGRTLGGAVLGTEEFIDGPVQEPDAPHRAGDVARSTPGCCSRAWRRCRCGSSSRPPRALERGARRSRRTPKVTRVVYPWLESHPQHELARRQMYGGGTVVTFELDGGKDEAFALMNALQVVDISNNLGDSKSLITHPATTTHRRLDARGAGRGRHHRRRRCGSRSGWRTCATWSRTSSAPWP